MNKEQQLVKDWMSRFGQDTPVEPTIPSLEVRKLRAKLILEEALETIAALGLTIELSNPHNHYVFSPKYFNELISFGYFDVEPNLIAIADGCADLKIVTDGTAVACGIDIEPVFEEVMRSNDSKLWTLEDITKGSAKYMPFNSFETRPGLYLVKDKDGKIIKPPSYSPANIKL